MLILSSDPAAIEERGGLENVLAGADLGNVLVGSLQSLQRVEATDELAEDVRESYGSAVSLLREVCRSVDSSRGPEQAAGTRDRPVAGRQRDLQSPRDAAAHRVEELRRVHLLPLRQRRDAVDRRWARPSATTTGSSRRWAPVRFLHDIGKLSLDQQVLNKQGSLDPEEWAHVRRHPVDGAQMVALMPGVDRSAIVTVLEHHMRYDGTGYPEVSSRGGSTWRAVSSRSPTRSTR